MLRDDNVKVVVASKHMQEEYKEIVNSHVIYWSSDEELLQKDIVEGDQNKILFGGRKDYEKGLMYAMVAIKRLKEENFNIKLVFAGSTRDSKVGMLARTYKIEDNVVELGLLPQKDFFSVIQDCGIVLCASIWGEPFNLNLLEGMSLGKPVIATNVGGQKEVIGDAGILINPKSSLEIVNAIKELQDKSRRKLISEKCKERAKKFRGCAERYLEVYQNLIHKEM